MDDDVRRAEEVEALVSIFGPDEFWCSADRLSWTARLSREPRAELRMYVPSTYPSADLPTIVIEAGWLSPASVALLSDELGALAALSAGMEVGLAWVQHAKQFVGAELEARAAVEAAAAVAAAEDEASSRELAGGAEPPAAPPDLPPIFSGEPLVDRKSTFQAHVARCTSAAEVRAVLEHLRADRKVARATHNQYAWRVWDRARAVQLHDNDDDGEGGAGSTLAELLELMGVNDVLVVVSRWYGGVHLGPDRFRHIVATARDAIERAGLSERGPKLPAAGAGGAQPASRRPQHTSKHQR